MALKFALKQKAYVLQLHLTTWHVGYNCLLTACMSVRVASHQQIYLNQLQLTSMHICSCGGWTSRFICYTCLRPTGMCLWSYPTDGLVNTIAPDHQACILQLHLTSSHVFIICLLSACLSVTVSSYQHPCISHLHQTINHVCNNSIRPFAMPFTVAPNYQSCLLNLHLQACMSGTLVQHKYPTICSTCTRLVFSRRNGCYNCIGPAGLYFSYTQPAVKMVMNICSMQISH